MAGPEVPSSEQLEVFQNPYPGRDYAIDIVCPEFTSVCPKTGHPDFGTITFMYTPDQHCIELKSLKLYLHRYRHVGAFYETVVNHILDDFVRACLPRRLTITGAFTARGGLSTTVSVSYDAPPTQEPMQDMGQPQQAGNWAASPDVWSTE